MRRTAIIAMTLVLALGAAACSDPAAALSKQSADQLRQLVKQSLTSGNHEAAYEAAIVLIEKAPDSAEGYAAAATALFEMSKANVDKINALLAQGSEKAKGEIRILSDWARQNRPDFTIDVPFAPDYASPDQINTVGITSGNMMNGERRGGQVTMQGEKVYFASRSQGDVLYKMDLEGEGFERLGDDPACFLNVVGDYIYYANQADDNKLYRIRTDGSEKARVGDDPCEYVTVVGDWAYYANLNDESRVYKVRIDGTERSKLSSKSSKYPCVADDWIYYSSKVDEGTLWRVNIDGSGEQKLTEFQVYAHCISDDWVYCLMDRKGMVIDRMRLDGSEATEVYRFDGKVSTFNVAGDRLFLSVRDDRTMKETIAIYNMDKKELEKTLDKVTGMVCTVGAEWLYYSDFDDGDTWYRVNLGSWEIQKLR